MKNSDYIRITAQIAILKEIAQEYGGQTIESIIRQLEERQSYQNNR